MPRYTLAQLLAQCEPGPFELDRQWMEMSAVGQECGSLEWTAAEHEGRLEAFVNAVEPASDLL